MRENYFNEVSAEVCLYEGQPVSTDMPSYCRSCPLYLNTCMPTIRSGYLCGAECADLLYCDYCPNYDICGK